MAETSIQYLVSNIGDWQTVAKEVARLMNHGTVLALSGPLGAGKTTFVQALAYVLGASSVPKSPTFSLIKSYKLKTESSGFVRLLHVDAYRIERSEDLLPLNLDEEWQEDGTIIVMEWPENATAWLEKQKTVLRMKIAVQDDDTRVATLT